MKNSFVQMLLSQQHLPLPVKCIDNQDVAYVTETICAFLNAQGGWIVLGVNKSKESVNLKDPDLSKRIQTEITSKIAPLPLVYIQDDIYNDSPVVLITVIKGSIPPYSYNGKYYISKGNDAVSPTSDEISQLMRDSISYESQWETIGNLSSNWDDLDESLMNEIYTKGCESGLVYESKNKLASILSELNLANSYEIKNGAVALFAKETKKVLPQCRLRIQFMNKGKNANEYEDTITITGNIFKILNDSIDYFKERLPKISLFLKYETTRYDDYIYPMDVLDEAISNALIHRDYSNTLDEITIFIFSDRVEITNPGQLPKNIIKGKSEVLPHGSYLRNPLMAEIFYIAGKMEKTGRGMALISSRMKQMGRKLPEWTCGNNKTTLTIFSKLIEKKLNERTQLFLKNHEKNYVFTKNEYIDYFDIKPSKITAQNDIQLMIALDACEKMGDGPKTRYKIIDRY